MAIAFFLLAALGLLLIPGPAVLYIVSRSVTQGRRAGLASVGGIELASLAHAVAAALGLSALLLASALAFDVVKYLGAAYLIFLGARVLLTREDRNREPVQIRESLSQLFAQGFMVNLLNPKTALFFYAFLPQFVDPAQGGVVEQIILLGVLFVLLASCTDSCYALLGSMASKWLSRKMSFQRVQRYVSGTIYIALGLVAAFTGSEKR